MEAKTLIDQSCPSFKGPDGYEYKGLPATIKEGLESLWSGEVEDQRKKDLKEWDKKVRLALTLKQAAVPSVPLERSVREAKMMKRPVATRSAGGWGGNKAPGAPSKDEKTAWASMPGVKVCEKKKPKEKKCQAVVIAPKKEKKEKKEVKKEIPSEEKESIKEPVAEDANSSPFAKKKYADVAKELKKLQKKVRQVDQIREEGPKDDAQKDKLETFPELKAEVEYLEVCNFILVLYLEIKIKLKNTDPTKQGYQEPVGRKSYLWICFVNSVIFNKGSKSAWYYLLPPFQEIAT